MRFDLPDKKKLLLELAMPIRWADMDVMGHVNNTTYLRYFEILRIEWGRLHDALPSPTGEGVVIVNTFCNFLRQLTFPGDVLGRYYVGAVGRTSFDCYITLERTDEPGVLVASGGARTVWFDAATQKPVPVPDRLRRLLLD